MYTGLPATILCPSLMDKELKNKCSNAFFDIKHKKEAISRRLRREEAKKEAHLDLLTLIPETRTNLCSFAKRFIKIGPKQEK